MLKFFFNRFSKMVLLMEVLGLLALVGLVAELWLDRWDLGRAICLSCVLAEYGFLRFCAGRRWYKNAPRGSGIELQFKKALVPTGYIMTVLGLASLATKSAVPLVLAAVLLAVIAHVNVILIYLHCKDTETTPVNFFSSGRFLNENEYI